MTSVMDIKTPWRKEPSQAAFRSCAPNTFIATIIGICQGWKAKVSQYSPKPSQNYDVDFAGRAYRTRRVQYRQAPNRALVLSFRDGEELLAQRGVTVSDEAVRQWGLQFGSSFATKL